jgi:hypothetical protein
MSAAVTGVSSPFQDLMSGRIMGVLLVQIAKRLSMVEGVGR